MNIKYLLATVIGGVCIAGTASAVRGQSLQLQPTSSAITLRNCVPSVQGRARLSPSSQNPNPSWTSWRPLSTLTGANGWSFNSSDRQCIWRPNQYTPVGVPYDLEWKYPGNNPITRLNRLRYDPTSSRKVSYY